jgi:hypothetical protein
MLRCFSQFGDVFASLLAVGAVFCGSSAAAEDDFAQPIELIVSSDVAAIPTTPTIAESELKLATGKFSKPSDFLDADVRQDQPILHADLGNLLWSQLDNSVIPLEDNSNQAAEREEADSSEPLDAEPLDLDPEVIQNSPVLQEWLQDIPDIADEIRNQPSFRTRFRVGYAQFPSSNQASGIHLGVEDVFLIAGTGLTASGSFSRSWNNDRESFGAEARYYLLPLGGYVNLAPTLGYRSLETPDYTTNGLDVGFRLLIVPSRGGGADIAVGQHWVAPGGAQEVGMTTISVGYAVTPRLRLGTDVEFQNSRSGQDSRVGLLLEWMM